MHTILFLFFFNMLVLSSCGLVESGFKADMWWACQALAITLMVVFVLKTRGKA